ncbi:MAG: DUF262 domain-containing protein [Fibrobacter sp.]|nr:DUF262 domain-containing protein [Fibrobacter sp.]
MSAEMICMPEATEKSFWEILNKTSDGFNIYIPRIQRDYAQGRMDETSSHIRDNFLNDIFESLVNPKKILDINFIYGNVEEERFIPIDGQQRLTTLFLLHWYFAQYSKKIADSEVKKRLGFFQYETRHVTGKFCSNLVEKVVLLLDDVSDTFKISDEIRNYYWFFSDFENDSSIKSMLVMLDAIHEKAQNTIKKGYDLHGVFDLLTSEDAPIRFLYLNINDIGLTDNIYIKMNARGKALTHFENFKAQLSNFLVQDSESLRDSFLGKVNGIWSEFFWNPEFRKKSIDPVTGKEFIETNYDAHMMKFFRFAMFMDYVVNLEDEAVRSAQKNIRDVLKTLTEETDARFTSRLFKDAFADIGPIKSSKPVLSCETFKRIERLLDILVYRKKTTSDIHFANVNEIGISYVDEKKSFLRLIGSLDEKRAQSNEEILVLFAEYQFLLKYSNPDGSFDKEFELNRLLRVVHNLIKPTLNLQMDVFFAMARSIYQVIEAGKTLDIYEFFASLKKEDHGLYRFTAFTTEQVVEESIKSKLIKNSKEWRDAIYEAEKGFLGGNLSMLFDFSGIWEINENGLLNKILSEEMSNQECFDKFLSYYKKFNLFFDKNGEKVEIAENSLFKRALLCYGGPDSYMLPSNKPIQSFLVDSDRDHGFGRLFRDRNGNKRSFFKELMDSVDSEKEIIPQLEAIVGSKSFDENERWKVYFVKEARILNSLHGQSSDRDGKSIFEIPKRFIRRNNNDDILLLTKMQTSSINRELYSYVLYLLACDKKVDIHYHAESTDGAVKYAYYTNKQNQEIRILYKRKDDENGYVFVAEHDGSIVMWYQDITLMLDYVVKTAK